MSPAFAVRCARQLWFAAFVALLGAWIADLFGPLLGLSSTHLFADATVLALLSLGLFADAWWHRQEA